MNIKIWFKDKKEVIAIDKNYNHLKHSLPGWLDVQVYEVDFKVSNSLSSLSLSASLGFFLYIMKLFLLFLERRFIFLNFIFHGYCVVYYTRAAVYIKFGFDFWACKSGKKLKFLEVIAHLYDNQKHFPRYVLCTFENVGRVQSTMLLFF